MGETGSDSVAGYKMSSNHPLDIKSNFSSQPAGKQQHVFSSHGRMIEEPIEEHPGPKPNPAGQSLIQKMNHLMT